MVSSESVSIPGRSRSLTLRAGKCKWETKRKRERETTGTRIVVLGQVFGRSTCNAVLVVGAPARTTATNCKPTVRCTVNIAFCTTTADESRRPSCASALPFLSVPFSSHILRQDAHTGPRNRKPRNHLNAADRGGTPPQRPTTAPKTDSPAPIRDVTKCAPASKKAGVYHTVQRRSRSLLRATVTIPSFPVSRYSPVSLANLSWWYQKAKDREGTN